MPGGGTEKVIKDLKIVGAGYRDQDYCPVCKASYRQRFQYLYFTENNIPRKDMKLLHIAPEECFAHLFSSGLQSNYVCGDLEPERYSYYTSPLKIDLTNIQFEDNFFDMVICNHVLEHIPDDIKAMGEINRILKPNGIAFLQVPISLKLNTTLEDPSIVTPEERLKKFGQKDHVRIYALDYTNRLTDVGFMVETYTAKYFSSTHKFDKLNLDKKEVLFICHK